MSSTNSEKRMADQEQKLSSPEAWVDEHGDALYRYALSRLHNFASAEDVVQETFLAALKAQDKFSGRSPARTWLIGILKHKIVDLIRKESREQPSDEIEAVDPLAENRFDQKGHWRAGLPDWQVNPGKILEQKEFRMVLKSCLSHLPPSLRNAFSLREMEQESTQELCKVLDVTPTNLWVMLYRARMRLQHCLNENWFRDPEGVGKSC